MIKPEMSLGRAAAILASRVGPNVEGVTPVVHGEISRAFYFAHRSRNYVIRFNASPAAFELDRFAGEAFASALPVPRVHELGQTDGLFYAISERLPGIPLQQVRWPWDGAVRTALVSTLDDLGRLGMADRPGYGPVGPDGTGRYATWEAFLLSLFGTEETGFWASWERLFDTSFLERAVFERLHQRMRSLIPFCQAERRVVHGDFHLGNILWDGRAVAGLVDWANLRYGDPLYDVATFHFWTARVGLPDAYAQAQAGEVPHYRERLGCYTLCLGLDAMRFFAKAGRRDAYESTRDRLLGMVGAG